MFNRPPEKPEHLYATTCITSDAIKLAYINRCHKITINNPFAKHMPSFVTTDLSHHIGPNSLIHEERSGIDFQTNTTKILESVFCAVIFTDDDQETEDTLQDIRWLLGDSQKWPYILVVTPPEHILSANTKTAIAPMVDKFIELPEPEAKQSLENVLLTKLTINISDLYLNTRAEVHRNSLKHY